MKFIVSRTSNFFSTKKSPCEEAKKDSVICTNYYEGKIMNCWSIEINTLEELMKFCEKYGEIIIRDNWWNNSYKEIEIYDDYRK